MTHKHAATGQFLNRFSIPILASIILLNLPLLAHETVRAEDRIQFTTEDYPPYNFMDAGTPKGAGYDQVKLLMEGIPADYTIEMMPWARAYALAQSDPQTCVFTTAHIPERDALFKWIEPLAFDRNIVMSRADWPHQIHSIKEARQYSIGTQRNDFTQNFLERNGFTDIDLAANLELTIHKLESGRIDLMPISEKFYQKLVKEGHPVKQQFVLTEQKFAIACNKDVPDRLIEKMQANLNRLIANGTQAKIFKTYGLMQQQNTN